MLYEGLLKCPHLEKDGKLSTYDITPSKKSDPMMKHQNLVWGRGILVEIFSAQSCILHKNVSLSGLVLSLLIKQIKNSK